MIGLGDVVKCKRHSAHPGRVGTVVSDWPGINYDYGVRFDGDEDKAAPTPVRHSEFRKLRWFGRLKRRRRRWTDDQD